MEYLKTPVMWWWCVVEKMYFSRLWYWIWKGKDPFICQTSNSLIKLRVLKEKAKWSILWVHRNSWKSLNSFCMCCCLDLGCMVKTHRYKMLRGNKKSGCPNWSISLLSFLFSGVVELVMPFQYNCSTVFGLCTHASVFWSALMMVKASLKTSLKKLFLPSLRQRGWSILTVNVFSLHRPASRDDVSPVVEPMQAQCHSTFPPLISVLTCLTYLLPKLLFFLWPPLAEGLATARGGAWAQKGSGKMPVLV